MEAAESLAGFAMLVTVGTFILGFLILGSFFIMAFDIGSILKYTKNMNNHQMYMQSSLDKLVKLTEEQAKEKEAMKN